MKDRWFTYVVVAAFAAAGAWAGAKWKGGITWAIIGAAAGAFVGEIVDDWVK